MLRFTQNPEFVASKDNLYFNFFLNFSNFQFIHKLKKEEIPSNSRVKKGA